MQEMFTKGLGELKNKQTEMNNTLKGIHSRITNTEEQIWKTDGGNHCHKTEYKKKNEKKVKTA